MTNVRSPRASLKVNGVDIIPLECEIRENTHHQADTMGASVSLDTPGADEKFWADLTSLPCVIKATNDYVLGGWVTKFDGKIDDVEIDLFNRVARVTGRDRISDLLDHKTTEQWQNRSVTDVVTDIAKRVGLQAVVSLPSAAAKPGLVAAQNQAAGLVGSANVGLIYQKDHNLESDQSTLWDVLVKLAQQQGCSVFVKPGTGVLSFMPVDQLGGKTFTLSYQRPTAASVASGNFTSLRLRRGFAVSKNVKVRVKSFQLKGKKSVSSEYSSNGSVPGEAVYDFRTPNMTKDQADLFAKNRLDEILRYEKGMQADMPGDVTLDPTATFKISGTGTSFDQAFIISSIVHRFGAEGYRMVVDVRNQDLNRKKIQSATASAEESTADQ